MLPGSQTAFDLDDVRAGLSYTVRVSARVGLREGAASILTVRRGECYRTLVCMDSLLTPYTPGSDQGPLSFTPRTGSPACHCRAEGCGLRCYTSTRGLGACSWSQRISD